MAWRCSGATNAALVDNLRNARLVKTAAVESALKATDRACYVPAALRARAYDDAPQPIGWNATIR